jgi:phosphoribosylformylglycinamidine cyclo-ligase
LTKLGVHTWNLGEIQDAPTGAALADYVQGAKGVDGGAVRLVGEYK